FFEDEALGGDADHGDVREDLVHAAAGGQGVGALPADLELAALGGVLHVDVELARAGGDIGGAAAGAHGAAGPPPVGEVALLGDLEAAEDGDVQVAAADDGEGVGGVHEPAAGDDGDGLAAGVAHVRDVGAALHLGLAEAEDAVFGVVDDALFLRREV